MVNIPTDIPRQGSPRLSSDATSHSPSVDCQCDGQSWRVSITLFDVGTLLWARDGFSFQCPVHTGFPLQQPCLPRMTTSGALAAILWCRLSILPQSFPARTCATFPFCEYLWSTTKRFCLNYLEKYRTYLVGFPGRGLIA